MLELKNVPTRRCLSSLVWCSSDQMSYKEKKKKSFLTCRRLRCQQVLSCGEMKSPPLTGSDAHGEGKCWELQFQEVIPAKS